jgi:tetratricopeptide (TPR) repeat protein/TolB-like protein
VVAVSAVAQAPAPSQSSLSSGPAPRPAPAARILVVPFENSGNAPQLHWLREAAAVLLTDGLRTGSPGSISRSERVHAFEQLYLPVTGSLSRATIIKVAQLVGASEVIVGSFRLDGSTLVVTARGIRLDAGRLQPEVVERGQLTDLFGIFDRLTTRFSADGGRSLASTNRVPLGAFENYIKGLLAENPVAQATFLEAALREHASFDRARLALWGVRAEQGDHAAALEALKPISASSPASVTARFFTGISLIELKRYDEAFTVLKALLEVTPSDASANAAVMNNLGVLVLRRGASPQTGTPAYFLTKATDVEPDPDYMFNLGYAYAMDRNFQGALYWLREALRRDPADVDAHYVLAVALQATGSTVEATRERDLARQLSSRYAELDRRADPKSGVPTGLERMRMDPEGSRAMRADQTIVNSAQREQRELAAFHLDQGRRLFDREQDRDAMAELRRAVYLSPYEARAHLLIGRIHLRAGRPADAIDAFKISIWSQDQAPAHVYLAEAYLKIGDASNARAEAQRALVLDPASADAKRLLSEIK